MATRILGIDAGSVTISVAEMDRKGSLLRHDYRFHEGHPRDTLAEILREWTASPDFEGWKGLAATRSAESLLESPDTVCDDHVAIMKAAGHIHGKIGSLLSVGGEKFGLFTWSGKGEYRSFKGNTSCAAGTGGFLDQQAERLGLSSAAELAALAESASGDIPKIATRCAVFAKTDLTHAQQEGFSLEAIADGLCRGLAGNLLDVLLDGTPPSEPLVLCGGVSRNSAVVRHIGDLTGTNPLVDEEAPLYGALGAGWDLLERINPSMNFPLRSTDLRNILGVPREVNKDSFRYPPLKLELSPYPDFTCIDSWEVPVEGRKGRYPVEVELFEDLPAAGRATLGIDIGSTSTKAVVLAESGTVLMGLYTRTAGRPVEAMKAVLMALDKALKSKDSRISVEDCATTGSGRKLVGEILGADLILDEITAHARAAVHLDPEVDTIIEIGGQDAKFTTLSDGRVTGSVMNNVCAAGTGSFLEEQAARLGCGIRDYAGRTEGIAAPLTSDRCTVFMQRDLNHLMTEGHQVNEVLASALHSVRENYLNKVAVRNRIGKKVFFQGATARIRTLVAAFEQALNKPILVSRFCSHTGALGAALQLIDEKKAAEEDRRSAEAALKISGIGDIPEALRKEKEPSLSRGKFRGLDLWKKEIPVHTEVCAICRNACKITVAEVDGQTTAFGFLCGRDYETEKFVPKVGEGSDPLSERKHLFRVEKNLDSKEGTGDSGASQTGSAEASEDVSTGGRFHIPGGLKFPRPSDFFTNSGAPVLAEVSYTLGLPAALYMAGELPFWEKLFTILNIPTVIDRDTDPIETGKALTGAEFCAPMTALHGRVARLLEKADYVFVPFYLDEKETNGESRAYCYYSQFAPSLVRQMDQEERILTPLVKTAWKDSRGPEAVREALAELPGYVPETKAFEAAWYAARDWFDTKRQELSLFHAHQALEDDVNVMLLGRPYVVADAAMNKDIPRLFAETGARVFDMEMMESVVSSDELPWSYASRIMDAAERIADTEGTYPVFITSFMCSPDSFALSYVREIWEKKGKPYLILELDGHGSSVGYGTRVEAAVRSFRNHFRHRQSSAGNSGESFGPRPGFESRRAADIRGKTLLIPNWDADVMTLVVANLRREGIDARLLEESDRLVREGSLKSDGQCLPLSIIAREVAEYVRKHRLDPTETALWMIKSDWSCNIPLYPRHIHHLLAQEKDGMDKVTIYIDTVAFTATTPLSMVSTYYAYMFGGLLKRIACRIRPYETSPGETDRVLTMARDRLVKVFMGRGDRMETVKDIVARFEAIPVDHSKPRPKVAIFGDVYVRDNEVMNQNLIRFIEKSGGEVVTMPYSRYGKMISETHFARMYKEKRYRDLAVWRVFMAALRTLEKSYNKLFEPLAGPEETYEDDPVAILAPYGVTPEHHGESMENLLKIHYLSTGLDDLSLFVQTSPSFCCAGLITEAMRKRIEEISGVPVVSITYDGTGGNKNDAVIPYLAFPRKAGKAKGASGTDGDISA